MFRFLKGKGDTTVLIINQEVCGILEMLLNHELQESTEIKKNNNKSFH